MALQTDLRSVLLLQEYQNNIRNVSIVVWGFGCGRPMLWGMRQLQRWEYELF